MSLSHVVTWIRSESYRSIKENKLCWTCQCFIYVEKTRKSKIDELSDTDDVCCCTKLVLDLIGDHVRQLGGVKIYFCHKPAMPMHCVAQLQYTNITRFDPGLCALQLQQKVEQIDNRQGSYIIEQTEKKNTCASSHNRWCFKPDDVATCTQLQ